MPKRGKFLRSFNFINQMSSILKYTTLRCGLDDEKSATHESATIKMGVNYDAAVRVKRKIRKFCTTLFFGTERRNSH